MNETVEIVAENAYNWGPALAILGALLAATLGGIGSTLGVAAAGKAAAGVTAEKPEAFGKLLVLEALPGSQGIYGLIGTFLVIAFFTIADLTTEQGFQIFLACLPLAFTALFSGVLQGKVAVAGANIAAKNPAEAGKAIVLAAIVETFAILGLLSSFLLLNDIKGAISA
ncbi:MAG: V-type ATP synthase subunit K [Candidatus Gracilibacteria bacterium]|jgi:V/A-type H+-transporting ATPase subunit K|nr:V-type ATP synthase subunit K [Candidatus Gracilibacteria bacterium]